MLLGLRGADGAFDVLRSALGTVHWLAAAQSLALVQEDYPALLVNKNDLAALVEHERLGELVWSEEVRNAWSSIEPRLLHVSREPSPSHARRTQPPTAETFDVDRESLEARLRQLLSTREFSRATEVSEVAGALGAIGSPESAKLLEESFETIDHSAIGRPLLEALHRCDAEVALRLAPDALYDCDFDTRLWATLHVPPSQRAKQRLRQIAADKWELWWLTQAARTRLDEWTVSADE